MNVSNTYQNKVYGTNFDAANNVYNPETPYQGVCPAGWHLPTYTELNALYERARGYAEALEISEQEALMAGVWSGNAKNLGFDALIPTSGPSVGSGFTMWGISEISGYTNRAISLMINTQGLTFPQIGKSYALYVRCIKN